MHSTFDSRFIVENQQAIIKDCKYAVEKFNKLFPSTNTTSSTNSSESLHYNHQEGYLLYNIFCLTAPSPRFHDMFQFLTQIIFRYCQGDCLYLQAWINFQTMDAVLDWHSHTGYDYHGYICIDPKDTITEFESYAIENKTGLIYIGPCQEKHRVVTKKPFEGVRITIGFDIIRPSDMRISNLGFLPIYKTV